MKRERPFCWVCFSKHVKYGVLEVSLLESTLFFKYEKQHAKSWFWSHHANENNGRFLLFYEKKRFAEKEWKKGQKSVFLGYTLFWGFRGCFFSEKNAAPPPFSTPPGGPPPRKALSKKMMFLRVFKKTRFSWFLMNFMIFENNEKRSTHTTHTRSVWKCNKIPVVVVP